MSNISEQKLNEILNGIINNYKMKGSISTNALCDILEKYDTSANQIDFVYKSIGEAGIQIVDEDERLAEYAALEKQIVETDAAWVPLCSRTHLFVTGDAIASYTPHWAGYSDFMFSGVTLA